MSLLGDIYYQRDYVALYKKEDESIFEFEFKEGESYFYNIALKRPIKQIGALSVDEGYCDLETAYGYGGYLTNSTDVSFVERALAAYKQQCLSERIIAEFIRFNPLNSFPQQYSQLLPFNVHDRNTVITAAASYDVVSAQYKSSLKRNIRKASQSALEFYQVQENKEHYADDFYQLYVKTMNKNQAQSFYYFDKTYFEQLLALESCLLFYVRYQGKIVNMILVLAGQECWYYHLGATDPDYYSLNTNPFMFDRIISLACDQTKTLYFGGGTGADENDPLLVFKKKFSPTTLPFYIAGNIHNRDVYNRYVKTFDQQSPQSIRYFLKYRLSIGSEQ